LAVPAQAQVAGSTFYVNTFSGQDCPITGGGGGGFSNCFATTSGIVAGPTTDTTASAVVAKIDNTGTVTDVNTDAGYSFSSSSFSMSMGGADGNTLLFTLLTGDPSITYISIKQAGNGASDGGYALFYDPTGFVVGTQYAFNLTTYFPNTPGFSHIDVYDHTGGVPEPATWAMMLLGFGGIGVALRRSRRTRAFMQVA
jgi:hypothetical protein